MQFYDGEWQRVGAGNFDQQEVDVLCRALGYSGMFGIPLLQTKPTLYPYSILGKAMSATFHLIILGGFPGTPNSTLLTAKSAVTYLACSGSESTFHGCTGSW
jgi:hypothetical protein